MLSKNNANGSIPSRQQSGQGRPMHAPFHIPFQSRIFIPRQQLTPWQLNCRHTFHRLAQLPSFIRTSYTPDVRLPGMLAAHSSPRLSVDVVHNINDAYYRCLIEAVKQFPILFNPVHINFHSVLQKNEAWLGVYNTLRAHGFAPVYSPKAQWESLVQWYRTCRRLGYGEICKFSAEMRFMDEFLYITAAAGDEVRNPMEQGDIVPRLAFAGSIRDMPLTHSQMQNLLESNDVAGAAVMAPSGEAAEARSTAHHSSNGSFFGVPDHGEIFGTRGDNMAFQQLLHQIALAMTPEQRIRASQEMKEMCLEIFAKHLYESEWNHSERQ